MFFKKIEFTSLQSWVPHLASFKGVRLTTATHLIALIVCMLVLISSTGLFLRGVLFALSFFFIAYWVISIFVYLYKKGQYGVFTRIIQRFWKRALWLFWLVELFLFCIYLFLAAISPQEVAYMLDNTQLVLDYTFHLKSFFSNTLNALVIILLINSQLLLHKVNSFRQVISAVIMMLLIRAVTEDFLQFYAINNFYSGYAWNHVRLESGSENLTAYKSQAIGVWEQEVTELKSRTALHYTYLLVFLKLWHTVFIFIVFVFLENATLRMNNTSYNTIAANLQNFYFLMFFNYILKLALAKSYINYLGTYVFYWFFVNYNAYDVTYAYSLYNHDYFLFIWSDLV